MGTIPDMSMERLIDYSRGDNLSAFWELFFCRNKIKNRLVRSLCTFLMCRLAHRHGGYVGPGAVVKSIPVLPHGLHGIFISRFAEIGSDCCIYQNVTIGEIKHHAPVIGDRCLIGAGAVLVGNIHVGNDVKIGAGCVVSENIPDGCVVVSASPRIIIPGNNNQWNKA